VSGESEIGVNVATGKQIIRVNPAFYRPAEVELLVGDAGKAAETLDWHANTTLEALCRMMVEADLRRQGG
jgi:GDPmannose 4,6-dehydratase